ncbi:MAG TPA: N-acetylmuramoyl-L-alanine amidase [Thermoanaerobaculia bacterium]|nr:N-acetylmuramoyl-L-alanine amidase [Thermoanaerobaculia bacterium]
MLGRSFAVARILLWAAAAAVAQEAPPPPEPPPPNLPSGSAVLVVAGSAPAAIGMSSGPAGPLFALQPIAERLGAAVAAGSLGQSVTLRIGETQIVLGAGSAAATVGQEIVRLTQAPVAVAGELRVPLDLLERTFGDLAGHGFEWRPGEQQLVVSRRTAQELPVQVELVHLQGVTTVVLQFPERPTYRVVQQEGMVEVQIAGDQLRAPVLRPEIAQDPLVAGIEVLPQRVRIALRPGTAAESYTLRDPFRLVFDIHTESRAAAPPVIARPPTPRPGIHTIVLDPGHGGGETGAVSASGTQEKALTLMLAEAVKSRLENRLPVRVVLTRSEDAQLPLSTRSAIANQFKADLFVSIHLNSSPGAGAGGAETYFLSAQASDARAASAAAAENRNGGADEDGDALYGLQLLLWDLAQSRYLGESQRLANLIQQELNVELGLRDRGVKQAPFRVLMGAAMPAVLVELGFLSNPEEEKKLLQPAYRSQLAEALTRAITRYKAQAEGGEAKAAAATP